MSRSLARFVRSLIVLATTVSVVAWGVVAVTNDAGPMGMLLGFAPRWWAAIPWLVLVPIAFLAGRVTIVVALVGALVACVGVAQCEWPARLSALAGGLTGVESPRGDIRVVTYNTDLSVALAHRLRDDVRRWDADVILLQDCKTIVADSLRAVFGRIVVNDRYCVASRWPIRDADPVAALGPTADPRLQRGAFGLRLRLETPYGPLPVYTIHLPSPRHALGAARWPEPRVLWPRLTESLAERGEASAAVSSVVSRKDRRFIVAGDFNLPYGSAILRRDWGDLTNAFAHAGFGFGHTMQAGIFPVRIDHVFVPEALEPSSARVLSGYPSEHQPLVVDLLWKG